MGDGRDVSTYVEVQGGQIKNNHHWNVIRGDRGAWVLARLRKVITIENDGNISVRTARTGWTGWTLCGQ